MNVKVWVWAGVFVGLAAAVARADEPASKFFFRPNDRVLFLGDSITEQYQYSSDIELYLTTRFPQWKLMFFNAGISGDTAAGGAKRFVSHILAEKPTAITIDFGMNDGGYGEFNAKRAELYLKSTEEMLAAAKKAGVRVALISPNAVEVRNRPQLAAYLETQKQFYAPLKELAAKFDVPFVDQYTSTRATLERIAADKAGVKPFPDAVHTGPAGGLLMAHAILTGLHAPALVSDARITIGQDSKTIGCTLRKVVGMSDGLKFERLDDALPMPIPKEWREILPYVNQLKDLNDYHLQVSGLTAGQYELTIDGVPVGTWSAAELGEGINLGLLDRGPIFDQGMKVWNAINEKNKLLHRRFRDVVMFQPQLPEWIADTVVKKRQAELETRIARIAELQAEIHALAQPKPRLFEITRVK